MARYVFPNATDTWAVTTAVLAKHEKALVCNIGGDEVMYRCVDPNGSQVPTGGTQRGTLLGDPLSVGSVTQLAEVRGPGTIYVRCITAAGASQMSVEITTLGGI